MDSKPDDHDPDLPPVGSAEDLEEALKWLEDLTARQSKSTDLSNPVPAASLDSPFRGLIDDDTGDLPDWLREAPTPTVDDHYAEGDAESRLDWLAKMAQRESIEELPTLEWRRLSEPVQSAIMGRGHEPQAEAPDTTPPAETEWPAREREDELADNLVDSREPEALAAEAVTVDQGPEIAAAPIDEVSTDEWTPDELGADEADVVAAAEEELRLEIEAGQEPPPLDDLDAAMAWIEELAASQDAPIEEIPSVADRALASKLMMAAGLSQEGSILDELGSESGLVEGLTPTHPFIEEEDFADTVVLVETIAADQGITLDEPESSPEGEVEAIPAAPELPATPGLDDFLPAAATDAQPEALSFEDAMAILDEIAIAQQNETGSAAEPLAEPLLAGEDEDSLAKTARDLADSMAVEASAVAIIESTGDETASLSAEEAPWNEAPDEMTATAESPIAGEEVDHIVTPPPLTDWDETPVTEIEAETGDTEQPAPEPAEELAGTESPASEPESELDDLADVGEEPATLEAALAALDALALPAGRTLDDLDARLLTAQLTPWRDVTSALDWLESALATQPSPAPVAVAVADVAPAGEGEAGWFDRMPEDPDAVLAWLEQMAAVEEREATPPAPVDIAPADVAGEESLVTTAAELGEADLLAMPEDPDEAMAWLESLAHGGPLPDRPASGSSTPEPSEPIQAEVVDVAPEPGWPVEAEAEEAPDAFPTFEEEIAVTTDVTPEMSWPVEEEVITAVEAAAETDDVAETAEMAPPHDAAADMVPTDEVATPVDETPAAPKRPRGRPRKTAVAPALTDETPPAPSQPPAESAEPAAEPPPPPAKPKKSWVDLLKPLD